MKPYDVMIVGGGMVGLALACALSTRTRLSVVVLEARAPSLPWSDAGTYPRVSALSLASQRIFQSLGVWEALQAKRVSPFSQMEVWETPGMNAIQFSANQMAETALGFIVENQAMQSALEEKLAQADRVDHFRGVDLVSFKEDQHQVTLSDASGRVFQASLAVAADGAHSWLRQQAGIQVDTLSYQQAALVATVKTALPHQRVARQVFLPSGPLAHLPLSDPRTSSIVWSLPTEEASACKDMAIDQFKQQLAQAFSFRLGEVKAVESRHVFPLYKQQAKQYVLSRVVLVGDAAHTMHPLAGQGRSEEHTSELQ